MKSLSVNDLKISKSLFLLDPEVTFLNHGSFGACPKRVFERYQYWQLEMEKQPVKFLQRRVPELLDKARAKLGKYLGCSADELIFFPNPTTAINMVVRNLDLKPGDEILSTDHEYGAMDRTWRFICKETGARYIQQPIPLPLTSPEELVEQIWSGVTANTKVLFFSHITSATALTFPAEELCKRAKEAGITSIVDGAHAVAQMELNLDELGADIYTGACHKWLCAPKGSAFLYVCKELQDQMLKPLVVSWGYEAEELGPSLFIDHHDWQGTRELAAFLAVPDAIEFQQQHDWQSQRERCHKLASNTRNRLNEMLQQNPISPNTPDWFLQMCAVQLPEVDEVALQTALYDRFKVEIPVYRWQGTPFVRASFQAYNDQKDADRLLASLEELVPKFV
ncbi:MAG: aminotransferase class V-fold PLP-dependent enzyme [Chloroflexi bacterium]|nr:MAG: aminotransferase class V-fold PLP-dependent enzyme [Chloroflexota bacterium]MBL1196048.1 aminotransferase class V-fold PLP-dependent enzyme [Chloroflexota bacterium]NOH13342.1 aminotransferase class V-fold PLP-dependent enzyme [Chloroflexota bacterium]